MVAHKLFSRIFFFFQVKPASIYKAENLETSKR